MANNIGLIMATRHDQREDHFIVLELIRDEYEIGIRTGVRPVNIERKIADHMKQTKEPGKPLYRKVWFVPIEVPK